MTISFWAKLEAWLVWPSYCEATISICRPSLLSAIRDKQHHPEPYSEQDVNHSIGIAPDTLPAHKVNATPQQQHAGNNNRAVIKESPVRFNTYHRILPPFFAIEVRIPVVESLYRREDKGARGCGER